MEHLINTARFLVVLVLLLPLSPINGRGNGSNKTDKESLVFLKNHLLKHSFSNCLSSWNQTKQHFCAWPGVSCDRKYPERVAALNLSSCALSGPLPSSITNLTFLRSIDLSSNELYGEIAPNILSRLQRLRRLILRSNSLRGALPTNLSSELRVLDLGQNNFSGQIPSAFFFFIPNLKYLSISHNNNSGSIPTSIGNLSSLKSLYMMDNKFEGSIPLQIGSLTDLINFSASMNNLSGFIPSSIYNLSYLRVISLSQNRLSGGLPTHTANTLPLLKILYLGNNMLSGSLKPLSNATNLVLLDLPKNEFTGRVPPDFGNSKNLESLNLEFNGFESDDAESWTFLDSLTNCTALQVLSLQSNELGGVLPKSIANLSIQLQFLSIGRNHITGSIPSEIEKLVNLNLLAMEFNNLSGTMPNNVGKLKMLQELSFAMNGLTGAIPLSLTNLTELSQLDLGDNKLSGPIPSHFGALQNLNFVNLEHNKLVGSIPGEVFSISSLSVYLGLAGNNFSGTLHPEVGKLASLDVLDLSGNKFTGRIPEALGSCKALTELYIDDNLFNGPIPNSVENLKNLQILDLSQNNLSGDIPPLQNLKLLQLLNLSHNNFEGEVPTVGVFRNASEISLVGNSELCGGIPELHLPACENTKKRRNQHHLLRILAPIISSTLLALVLLLSAFITLHKCRNRRRAASEQAGVTEPFPKISYAELVKATDGFSSANLVGRGRYGSVYKGTLQEGQTREVAIKVFNLDIQGGFRSFTAECDALRSIRHRNLVRVLTSCSSIDFSGRDFKALVFDFMAKGNLETWLHREYESYEEVVLDLEQRLSIAADVADALEYLHHNCQPPIIHFDMKPSNILLDNDMMAHVGDFGLSRFVPEAMSMSLQDKDSSNGIKGTIGYVAPEYGGGARPSTSADVYSFGILLLEMLTGRRPTDDMFNDGLDLHKHVEFAFPHRIIDILDIKILAKGQRDANRSSREEKCFLSLAEVGLSCSIKTPEDRPCIRDVAAKLHEVKFVYFQSKRESEQRYDRPSEEGGAR